MQTSFLPPAVSGPKVKEVRTDKDITDLLAKLTNQNDFALDVTEDHIVFAFDFKECFLVLFEYFLKNKALRSDLKAVLENRR